MLGALTYGELGAMHPEVGGLYVYVRDAFGSLVAFLCGWAMFFVISSGAVADARGRVQRRTSDRSFPSVRAWQVSSPSP